jgi:hypothetical protein
MQFYSETLGG